MHACMPPTHMLLKGRIKDKGKGVRVWLSGYTYSIRTVKYSEEYSEVQ